MLDLRFGPDKGITSSNRVLKEVLSGGRARLQMLADFFGESVEIVDPGGALKLARELVSSISRSSPCWTQLPHRVESRPGALHAGPELLPPICSRRLR